MVLNPQFFNEAVEFQLRLQKCVDEGQISVEDAKTNPLYRSIGFLETI